MAKKNTITIEDVKRLAEQYGLVDNAVYNAAVESYFRLANNADILQKQIDALKDCMDPDNIKLLHQSMSLANKTNETMNKVLQTIVTLLRHVGQIEPEKDALDEFLGR